MERKINDHDANEGTHGSSSYDSDDTFYVGCEDYVSTVGV